jgi:GNAT superfamily N-acetyltransferase
LGSPHLWHIRLARLDDRSALESLIARSARALGAADYTVAQIEGALAGAFGIDTQLILDSTYYAVVIASGRIVACGGWSRRRTLFGSDTHQARDAGELDPAHDAARIRAFFVDPEFARQGIGHALLLQCEAAARAAGFVRTELMATLTGVRLYARFGYVAGAALEHAMGDELAITFVPMARQLGN